MGDSTRNWTIIGAVIIVLGVLVGASLSPNNSGQFIGFGTTAFLALLAWGSANEGRVQAKETHRLVNSQLSAMTEEAKKVGRAEGKLTEQADQAVRDATPNIKKERTK